jgi:hypothetical protein
MCGIAAVWGSSDEGVVRQMMDRIAHRGPVPVKYSELPAIAYVFRPQVQVRLP